MSSQLSVPPPYYSEGYHPPPKFLRVAVATSTFAFVAITIAAALGLALFTRTAPHQEGADVYYFSAGCFAVIATTTGIGGLVLAVRARRRLGEVPRRRHLVLALSAAFVGLMSAAAGIYLCVNFARI